MDEHSTSEIRMIATDVVDQQAKVCERRMQNIEGKIDGLAKDLDEFKTDIKSDIKGMRADARADNLQLRLDLKAVEQQSIRLDGRWKIFTPSSPPCWVRLASYSGY